MENVTRRERAEHYRQLMERGNVAVEQVRKSDVMFCPRMHMLELLADLIKRDGSMLRGSFVCNMCGTSVYSSRVVSDTPMIACAECRYCLCRDCSGLAAQKASRSVLASANAGRAQITIASAALGTVADRTPLQVFLVPVVDAHEGDQVSVDVLDSAEHEGGDDDADAATAGVEFDALALAQRCGAQLIHFYAKDKDHVLRWRLFVDMLGGFAASHIGAQQRRLRAELYMRELRNKRERMVLSLREMYSPQALHNDAASESGSGDEAAVEPGAVDDALKSSVVRSLLRRRLVGESLVAGEGDLRARLTGEMMCPAGHVLRRSLFRCASMPRYSSLADATHACPAARQAHNVVCGRRAIGAPN